MIQIAINTSPSDEPNPDSHIDDAQSLQDLASIARSLSSSSAQLANTRIAARNKARSDIFLQELKVPPKDSTWAVDVPWQKLAFEPLQKTVPGSGYALAVELFPRIDEPKAPKPEAPIGSTPPDFHSDIRDYYLEPRYRFDLVEFYNESLGLMKETRNEIARGQGYPSKTVLKNIWIYLTT